MSVMKYQIIPQNLGAKRALQERRGKCSEYSAAMVALLRAKKIPARVVTGNMARSYDTKHEWVEVYFDKYGWVTFDPTLQGIYVYSNSAQSRILDAFNIDMGYITSSRNDFTPWNLTYTYSSNANSSVSVSGSHKISKI